jgi:hypothetical protein
MIRLILVLMAAAGCAEKGSSCSTLTAEDVAEVLHNPNSNIALTHRVNECFLIASN